MNWRWIVPTAYGVAFTEIACGAAAYSSPTWNLQHTEVLYRWDAVREVCLIYVPITFCACALFGTLFIAALEWASRGGR